MNQVQYWRKSQTCEATQLSETTIWRLERAGKFPARRKLSDNAVGWLRSEIEAWMASRQPSLCQPCISKDDAVGASSTQNITSIHSEAKSPDKSNCLNNEGGF